MRETTALAGVLDEENWLALKAVLETVGPGERRGTESGRRR